MIRRIDPDRLENILVAFFRPDTTTPQRIWLQRFFPYLFRKDKYSMHWLASNIVHSCLPLFLAYGVVSAVTAADPDETRYIPIPVPLEMIGQDLPGDYKRDTCYH